MVGLIIAFPGIVTREVHTIDEGNMELLDKQFEATGGGNVYNQGGAEPSLTPADASSAPAAGPSASQPAEEDPMEAIRRANEQDKAKK